MAQIMIEIPDDLAQRLAPFQGQLADLFVRLIELVLLQQAGSGLDVGLGRSSAVAIDLREATETPRSEAEDFFSCAGIWENREITAESLRIQAWQRNQS